MEDSRHLSRISAGTRYHKEERVNNMQLDFEFQASNNKKYEVDSIWDSAVYARQLAEQLPGLYYLVSWKSYLKEENTWESASAIQYL